MHDRYSGSDDEWNSGGVFFGDDAQPEWGVPQDNEQDDESVDGQLIEIGDRAKPTDGAVIAAGQPGVISYDRGDNEVVIGPTSLGRSDDLGPGTRTSRAERDYAQRARERQAINTGDRNIRGATPDSDRGDRKRTSGIKGDRSSSIEEAANRLRADLRTSDITERESSTDGTGRMDDRVDRVEEYIKVNQHSGGKRNYTRRTISHAPTFEEIDFECQIYGIKANASGDWMITIKVPYEESHAATALAKAYGLALRTRMTKKGLDQ